MQFVHLFANPLVIILLVASAISASLGQRTDALIIIDCGSGFRELGLELACEARRIESSFTF